MRAGSDIERKLTATCTAQWTLLGSPARVSRKREFSWISLETFGISRPKKCERQSLETLGDEKSPQLAALSHQEKKILRKQEWVADLGGFELPYSHFKKRL
jgi:hypothetical protein